MATIPRHRLQTMTLPELYSLDKMTPSITKRILMLEDFSTPKEDYCRTHCLLPAADRCPTKHMMLGRRADVLIVWPRKISDSSTKYGKSVYGWSEDSRLEKAVSYLEDRHLAGLSVEHSYLLKCRPRNPKSTTTTLKKCLPYLLSEIGRVKPKILLALGKETTQGLGITRPRRGLVDYIDVPGMDEPVPVLTTLHPRILFMIRQNASGQFWGPDYLTVLNNDFIKAGKVARGEIELQDVTQAINHFVRTKLHIVSSIREIEDLVRLLDTLPENSILSFDTETTSLDPWSDDARLLCIQFGFRHPERGVISVVVPLWHRENSSYNPDEAWTYIEQILLNPRLVKIGHNLSFDITFLRVVYNVEPFNVQFDTMLLLHSLNSGIQGFYDLKTSVADWLFETQLGGYEDRLDLKALKKMMGADVGEDEEDSVPDDMEL